MIRAAASLPLQRCMLSARPLSPPPVAAPPLPPPPCAAGRLALAAPQRALLAAARRPATAARRMTTVSAVLKRFVIVRDIPAIGSKTQAELGEISAHSVATLNKLGQERVQVWWCWAGWVDEWMGGRVTARLVNLPAHAH